MQWKATFFTQQPNYTIFSLFLPINTREKNVNKYSNSNIFSFTDGEMEISLVTQLLCHCLQYLGICKY
jgi:hypothetical protein